MTGACAVDTSVAGGFGSVRFDGRSCVGYLPGALPGFSPAPDAAFTAVVIARLNASKPLHALLHTGRTPSNNLGAFLLNAGTVDPSFLFGSAVSAFNFDSPFTPLPASEFSLFAFARSAGGTSGAYYQSTARGPSSGVRVVRAFSGQALVGLAPSDLVLGADIRNRKDYLQGSVAVVQLHNRALSLAELNELFALYAPRFNWSLPAKRECAWRAQLAPFP